MPTPVPPSEPVVFGTSIEALVDRALRGRMTPQAQAGIQALGIDLRRLKVAYDYTTWVKLQQLLVDLFYPRLTREQALQQLGRDYIQGLEHTLVGKALFAMSRLSGVRKMLERMTRNVRTANNYMESLLEPLPDGTFLLHYQVVPALVPAMQKLPSPSPHYFHGILQAAMAATGARDIRVDLEQIHPADLRWSYRVAYSA